MDRSLPLQMENVIPLNISVPRGQINGEVRIISLVKMNGECL